MHTIRIITVLLIFMIIILCIYPKDIVCTNLIVNLHAKETVLCTLFLSYITIISHTCGVDLYIAMCCKASTLPSAYFRFCLYLQVESPYIIVNRCIECNDALSDVCTVTELHSV